MGAAPSTCFFLKTFNQMGLSRSPMHMSRAPFHGIVPSVAAMPIGEISLLVIFRIQENIRTETIQFEVVDFETAYNNAFLGWLALTKFTAIPHYAYLVPKMSGPWGHLH
jgi:hypothetical protein